MLPYQGFDCTNLAGPFEQLLVKGMLLGCLGLWAEDTEQLGTGGWGDGHCAGHRVNG